MAYNPQFEKIGMDFINYYYSKFDVPDPTVRAQGLADLYDDSESYMTFEGDQMKGKAQILTKYQTDEDLPQSYVHTFILRPLGGSFFISNEIFRLVLHNA